MSNLNDAAAPTGAVFLRGQSRARSLHRPGRQGEEAHLHFRTAISAQRLPLHALRNAPSVCFSTQARELHGANELPVDPGAPVAMHQRRSAFHPVARARFWHVTAARGVDEPLLHQTAHCAGTPFWKLVLKQFDDYLVKVLIAAAIVDLIIALVNGERGAGCA